MLLTRETPHQTLARYRAFGMVFKLEGRRVAYQVPSTASPDQAAALKKILAKDLESLRHALELEAFHKG